MSVVYRVLDRVRGREVALKTLTATSARDLYRFKREFRALCDLAHPNLCTLHELYTINGDWFLTMELVPGVSFIDWVRPSSTSDRPGARRASRGRTVIAAAPVRLDRLTDALAQLCDGVLALHLAGKLHRDLKPSNVLVEPGGRVVLLDFGLVAELAHAGPRPHPYADGGRDAGVHVARAGRRRGARPGQRLVLGRLHAVRGAHRAPPVRGLDGRGAAPEAARHGAAAAGARARHAGGARRAVPPAAGAAAGRPPRRSRHPRRARPGAVDRDRGDRARRGGAAVRRARRGAGGARGCARRRPRPRRHGAGPAAPRGWASRPWSTASSPAAPARWCWPGAATSATTSRSRRSTC